MKSERRKKISVIVAMTEEGVIGIDNNLPWHISEDLKLFKKTTDQNILVMGRHTFESIGKPLPGRISFVISKSADTLNDKSVLQNSLGNYECGKAYYFSSLEEAFDASEQVSDREVFVIGGASVYGQAIPFADKLFFSMIKNNYPGNVYFPQFDKTLWQVTEEIDYTDFVFTVLERKS